MASLAEILILHGIMPIESIDIGLDDDALVADLMGRGRISTAQVAAARAAQAGMPFVELLDYPVDARAVGIVPAALDAATLDALWSLPIGWTSFPPRFDQHFLLQCAGWLITAATALFGAPFWFDLLQRTVQMRGTGATPAERRDPSRKA